MNRRSLRTMAVATGLVLVAHAITVTAAEGTVEALSSWEARGQIYPTGPKEATFVGALSGVVYVKDAAAELDIGALDTAVITCPGTITINTENGSQKGSAKCVLITPDGERIYASFECTGTLLQGCNGDFVLTGGSGERAQISGSGPIQLRSGFAQLAATPGAIIDQAAAGVAVWPKLTYKLP